MRVIEGLDLDDVLLANLVQESRHYFVEVILAHLHAVIVPDALRAKLDSLVCRGFERLQRLADERFGGSLALRNGKVLLLFRCGRGGNGIDDRGRDLRGLRSGNDERPSAGWTLNLAPDSGGIDG